MGRHQKVTAQEVLDQLNNNEYITKHQLANIFECTPITISKRLRELRECGEKILHNLKGLFILDEIKTEEDYVAWKKWDKWLHGAINGIVKCGKPTKPLVLQSKKYLKSLPKHERKLLTKSIVQTARLLDYIEMEEELDN